MDLGGAGDRRRDLITGRRVQRKFGRGPSIELHAVGHRSWRLTSADDRPRTNWGCLRISASASSGRQDQGRCAVLRPKCDLHRPSLAVPTLIRPCNSSETQWGLDIFGATPDSYTGMSGRGSRPPSASLQRVPCASLKSARAMGARSRAPSGAVTRTSAAAGLPSGPGLLGCRQTRIESCTGPSGSSGSTPAALFPRRGGRRGNARIPAKRQ